jgi:serine/threonine protein kinase
MGISRAYVLDSISTFLHPNLPNPKTNILIDRDGCARLTDFALISMVSDQSTSPSSLMKGGTIQWMSPELLDPEKFGLRRRSPTKESDCYAMGMIVYEVLSGQTPFAPSSAPVIVRKVLDGERPERPQGINGKHFTDGIWRVVQLCLIPQPRDRISASTILLSLEGNPIPLRPSSDGDGDVEVDSDDHSNVTASDSGMFSQFHPRLIFNSHRCISGLPIPRGSEGLPAPPLSSTPSARTMPMIPQGGL